VRRHRRLRFLFNFDVFSLNAGYLPTRKPDEPNVLIRNALAAGTMVIAAAAIP
jgi:hypothetical protein